MKRNKKIIWLVIICFFIIVIISLIILVKPYLYSQKEYSASDFNITELKSTIDKDGDGIDDYTDIMLGAREYISTQPKYKSKYYEGGYPDDGYGVCTDVIWNAFKSSGYDLKELVDEDIANNLQTYNTIDEPDPNIDFRRVKNLKIFFDNNATILTTEVISPEEWQPGDVVVFSNHIAICSDKRNSHGIPFIIHHDSRGSREGNDIYNYKIVGHYRLSEK
jgi:uncharacterized protein YijF (DUF1287 family)